jgi:hypothetical protein
MTLLRDSARRLSRQNPAPDRKWRGRLESESAAPRLWKRNARAVYDNASMLRALVARDVEILLQKIQRKRSAAKKTRSLLKHMFDRSGVNFCAAQAMPIT